MAACAAVCGSVVAPASAIADEAEWRTSGTIRLRYEVVDNQVRPNFNQRDDIVSLRTTLFAERRDGPLRLGLEVYDSRAWDADRGTPISTSEVNTLEAVQAYAAVDLGSKGRLGQVSLQVGRFMLNLGSRRLVAADDFRNTTNGYTGLRADLAPFGVRTTLVYVLPQSRLPDDLDSLLDQRQRIDHEGEDLRLWGGVASKPAVIGPASLEISYFNLHESDRPNRPTRDRRLDTLGVRSIIDPKPGRFDGELEAILQTGTIRAGLRPSDPELDVRAGFVHADLGYTFTHPWRPRLSAEFDIATGDKPGGRFTRFDTLFGMRRADFAPSGLYAAIGRANLVTPGLRLEVTPPGRWDAFATARAMWAESRRDAFSTTGVRDPTGSSGRYAGFHLEGRARYWLVQDRVRSEVNAAWLDKGRLLRDAPNAPKSGNAAYLALSTAVSF